ncbi:37s ribosomal protein [Fusarium austroafricanum]|uniref:37s ribosomal protein n=1 Tax=Fusarium austroafricanum TaxID=2364996 RepID=A0A8H4KAY3_9HYPO|nr:37s ribosomal protein [Fusarium austroafricanum]
MVAERLVNIIILGAPASGKKSFIRRYCQGVFTDLYDPITGTSGDRRLANIPGIPTIINLERIPSTFIQYAPEARRIAAEADALILLDDGSSHESQEELWRMRLQVLALHLGETAPSTTVVAGKADGAESAGIAWEQGIGEGRELAVQLGAKFGVASALWGMESRMRWRSWRQAFWRDEGLRKRC